MCGKKKKKKKSGYGQSSSVNNVDDLILFRVADHFLAMTVVIS